MSKRIKIRDRALPNYSRGEEIMNMVTHIVGGGLGVIVLILCLVRSILNQDVYGIVGSVIYGVCMITLYTMSSVYHGMKPCTGKKVMQVMDHCTIYFLIAGTYTVIALTVLRELNPWLGWGILAFQWILTAVAVTLTAIDLHKYNVFSMICYIFMGWCIIFFLPMAIEALTLTGFYWMLAGGIAYTIGAVLYGIGSKKRWMHSVFHIFVVLGSFLQFVSIFLYCM